MVNNPRPDEAIKLSTRTTLSPREAELYILHVEEGKSLSEAAEEMGTENEKNRWDRVKQKIVEAEKKMEIVENTAELNIP